MAKFSADCKKLMVEEIASRFKSANTLIVTNYKGLASQDLNELRKELRNISDEYVVVKDSMAKRALTGCPHSTITEFIKGEVGIVIDKKEDPSYSSKVLIKFSKSHDVLKICGGIMNGTLISKEDIAVLAALPSREVLLGKLANVLNAPIQGVAAVLNGIISKLVYVLSAVEKKKLEETSKKTEDREKSGKEEIQPENKD